MDFFIKNNTLVGYSGTETNIFIPEGVTSIDATVFYESENLQSITIPNSITHLEDGIFYGCKNLQSVTISNGVTQIDYGVFLKCENLKNITIGNNIKNINKNAFPEKMNVRKWVLAPNTVDETQCKMLLDVFGTQNLALSFLLDTMETNDIILKNLQSRITAKKFREKFAPILIKEKEASAFAKLLSLVKKMPLDELDSYIDKSKYVPEIQVLLLKYKDQIYPKKLLVKIEELQTKKDLGICEKNLADYKKIFSIKKENGVYLIKKYKGTDRQMSIPTKIKGIPVYFALCDTEFPTDVYLENGHTFINDCMFERFSNLHSISIPNSVTSIGENAFDGCINLQSIYIPNSVTSIGKYAFSGCFNLQNIRIPNDLMMINKGTFSWCTSLKNILIPSGVTSIEEDAFCYCSSLKQITITNSDTIINDNAFSYCKKLTIQAPAGSRAEKYAKEHNLKFQILLS